VIQHATMPFIHYKTEYTDVWSTISPFRTRSRQLPTAPSVKGLSTPQSASARLTVQSPATSPASHNNSAGSSPMSDISSSSSTSSPNTSSSPQTSITPTLTLPDDIINPVGMTKLEVIGYPAFRGRQDDCHLPERVVWRSSNL
jgi:hypothetical protein